MADVPDDIDARVAYLVMLNGKEESRPRNPSRQGRGDSR
jgi:hypothetical protein